LASPFRFSDITLRNFAPVEIFQTQHAAIFERSNAITEPVDGITFFANSSERAPMTLGLSVIGPALPDRAEGEDEDL
jgi:hypothetical protein